MTAQLTVAEIARRLGAALEGDGARVVAGVAGVRDAGPDELAFVSQARYAADAEASAAAALLVESSWDKPCKAALLRVSHPERAFAEAAAWFVRAVPSAAPGVHPSAIVSPQARLGTGVTIGPLAVVEAEAELGEGVVVGAQCYVGYGVQVGAGSRLYPQVSLREHVRIGCRCVLHNGVVVGSDGFGYDVDKQGVRTKQPQIGTVVIGDDVEIGANSTIDRARFGKTRIGNGVKIDNLVQIAHNVVIGDHAVLVAQVGVAGSTRVGPHAILAGQVGVAGHLTIGAGAVIGAQAGVTKDVPPRAFMWGTPAIPHKESAKLLAMVSRLPELRARVEALEKKLAERSGGSGVS